MAYYYSRNGGWLERKINPNFGEWVKTRAEFANTRKNAAEFSAAGATASALVRGITQRWRFITSPKLTGDATAVCVAGERANVLQPWGERSFAPGYFYTLQDCINRNIKKRVPNELQQWLKTNVRWDSTNDRLKVLEPLTLSAEMEQYFRSMGATGVRVELWLYRVQPSVWDSVARKWLPAASQMSDTAWAAGEHTITGAGGAPIIIAQENSVQFVPQNTQNYAGGVLMFIAPYKEVAGTKQVLQSACTAFWYSVDDEGDAPTPGQTLTVNGNVYPAGQGSITGLGTYQSGQTTNIAFLDENGDPFTGWITVQGIIEGVQQGVAELATDWENVLASDIISQGITELTLDMYNGVVPIIDYTIGNGDSPGGGWSAPVYCEVGDNAYFGISNLPEGAPTPWLMYRQYAQDYTLLDAGKVQTVGISIPVQGMIMYAWCANEPVLEPEEWEIEKPDDIDIEILGGGSPEIGQQVTLISRYSGTQIAGDWTVVVDGVTTTSSKQLDATFTIGKYNRIEFRKIGQGLVTITTGASPQAAGHVVGGGDWQPGLLLSLMAVRDDASYIFDHWEKDGVAQPGSSAHIQIIVEGAEMWVAVFVQG